MQENTFETQSTSARNDPYIDRIMHLAKQQGHWLERLTMPGLASIFTISLLILGRQYLVIMAPQVCVPRWVIAAGAIAAVESIYAAGMHLRLRTPVSLRILELLAILSLVYVGLRIGRTGGEYPFFSSLIWRNPDVLLPLLLVAGAWSLARGYGQAFVGLGDIAREVGDQGAQTFSWETESYLSDYQVSEGRSRTATYFTRRFLFYASLSCVLNAIVIEGFPERLAQLTGWSNLTNLATLGLLFSGLLLQACVYLYRLQVIWQEVRIPVGPELPSQWVWSSIGFIGLVLLLGSIVPAGLSPLSFSRTMAALGRWLGKTMEFSVPQQQPGGGTAYTPSPGLTGVPEAGVFSWLVAIFYFIMSFVMVVVVLGVVAALVGLVLLTFFRDEWEKLHGLFRIPVYVYLWSRETLRQLLRLISIGARRGKVLWNRLHRAEPVRQVERGTRRQLHRRAPPTAAALYVRYLFGLLIEAAGRHGMAPGLGETPLEYSASLGSKLHTAQEELELLTDSYLEARYSEHDLPADTGRLVDTWWKAVMAAINSWSDGDEAPADKENGNQTT